MRCKEKKKETETYQQQRSGECESTEYISSRGGSGEDGDQKCEPWNREP